MSVNKAKSKKYLSIFSVLIFLTVWELSGRFELVDPLFTSYPTRIFLDGFDLIFSGKLIPHFVQSLSVLFVGFSLAIVTGVLLGLAIGYSGDLYDFFSPYIFFLNSLPKIALVPLIIIWLGIGFMAKVLIIFLMALIPVLINTIEGVRATDQSLIRMAKSFGVGKLNIIKSIVFFNSIPFIFSGIKISTGKAIVGLVIAELFGRGRGLGYLLSFYGANFQTSRLMFVIAIFAVLSLVIIKLTLFIERAVIRWK